MSKDYRDAEKENSKETRSITIQDHLLTYKISILLAGTILLLPVSMETVWADTLFGTAGPDTLTGTNNADNIFGLEGNDNLSGQGGDDYIGGDSGNDVIDDGPGADIVLGGSGADTINLEGTGQVDGGGDGGATAGFDEAHGEGGRDIIEGSNSVGYLLIYGEDGNDRITTGGEDNNGRMFGGAGDDYISTCCDSRYDAWGGPGNDEIWGSSECSLDRAFGGSGNDKIYQSSFAKGGSGNDVIQFYDCGGVAYGDRGNDFIGGAVDFGIEAHGGSEDDTLVGNEAESNRLFGDDGNDRLTGGTAADQFSCGPGIDTITNFNAAEGDTKTADCENFPSNVAPLTSNATTPGTVNNAITGDTTTPTPGTSNATVGNVPATEQDSTTDASERETTTTTPPAAAAPNEVQPGQQQNQTTQQ